MSKYRDAGREVIEALLPFRAVVERASVDEAYLDLTQLVIKRKSQAAAAAASTSDMPNTHLAKVPGDRETSLSQWLVHLQGDDWSLAQGAVIAEEMRARIFAQTGFRCSAGIARNKVR